MAERKDVRKMTVQELKEHRKSLEDKEIIDLLTDYFTMLELRNLVYDLSDFKERGFRPGDREKLSKSTKIQLAIWVMKLGRYNAKSPFIKELKEAKVFNLNRRKPTSPRKEVERKSSKKSSSPRHASPKRESKRPASPRRTSSKKA